MIKINEIFLVLYYHIIICSFLLKQVCRDFQRGNCTRGENECRYGHPPDRSMIDVTDNTVTVCMDWIKGRCARDKCKYFHPPTHLQVTNRN